MFTTLFATHKKRSNSSNNSSSNLGKDDCNIAPPPLDHKYGWLVVAGAFVIQGVTFGLMNSFTTFTQLMEDDVRLGNPTRADLSLGSSVSSGIGPFLGVAAGYAVDRFGAKPMIVLLALGMAFAFLVGAQATSVTGLVLLYSVPLSVASACCNSPVATSVGSWFDKKLSIAMGVTYMGGGVGAALIPWLAGHLAAELKDWRECYRYLALLTILPLTVGTLLLRVRPPTTTTAASSSALPPPPLSPLVVTSNSCAAREGEEGEDEVRVQIAPPCQEQEYAAGEHVVKGSSAPSVATEDTHLQCSAEPTHTPFLVQLRRACKIAIASKSFWVISLISWCFCYSYFGFLYVLIPYVLEFGSATNDSYSGRSSIPIESAVTFYTFYGVSGSIGHLSMGIVGYALNNKMVFTICSVFGSVGLVGLIFAAHYWQLAIVVCILGFAGAGCWNAVPALLVEHFMGPDLGTVMGLGFSSVGVAALMASPVTAHIAESEGHDYTISIVLMAVSSAAGALVCVLGLPSKAQPSATASSEPTA